jgi:hypothetical protein
MRRIGIIGVCLLLGMAARAAAQEAGQAGIAMGYPTSVAVIFHATDKVAVRPEFSFRHSTSDLDFLGQDGSRTTTGISVGASGLFYLRDWDKVRTYVSPRYEWTRTTSESDVFASEARTTGHAFTGSFGAQYALDRRFGVFGEVGLTYDTADAELDGVDTDSNNRSWSSRTAVGVIFYFK